MSAIQCTWGKAQNVTAEILKGLEPKAKIKGDRIFAAVISNSLQTTFIRGTLKELEGLRQNEIGSRKVSVTWRVS